MSLSQHDQHQIDEVAQRLKKVNSVLFITGAGLSADSNLPTYRGVGGLYNDNAEDGMPIEEALSGGMMMRRPALPWKYISQIERSCRGAVHNRGHEVIAALEAALPKVWVLTQNVDGFHHQAGSEKVIDIHGQISVLYCTGCGRREEVDDYSHLECPPYCKACGAVIRPDVVLFGEMLPMDKVAQLQRILEEGFQMVFIVGTSGLFPYVVEPVIDAKRCNIPTVEINPGTTDLSNMVDYKITAGAAEALDAIWSRFSS